MPEAASNDDSICLSDGASGPVELVNRPECFGRSAVEGITPPALTSNVAICLCCELADMQAIVCLDACNHQFCQGCLHASLTRSNADYQHRVACPKPGCSETVPAYLCRQLLTPSEHQALESASIEPVLATGAYIRCPACQQRYEKQPGEILGRDQDSACAIDGSEMTPAALRHRALHRFRCPCGVDFCDACGSNPYHNGFSCEKFRSYSVSKFCRFCHAVIGRRSTTLKSQPVADVCASTECIAKAQLVCQKTLVCSHRCGGIARESKCLRCLRCPDQNLNIAAEEFCNICWVESLGSAPCIQLRCGHIFHIACVQQKLSKRWPGSRISFGFLSCPLCHDRIAHPSLTAVLRSNEKLRKDVTALAMKRLRAEQMTQHDKIVTPGSRYYNQAEEFALDTFAFYQCFKCKKPYFGGRRECGDMVGLNEEQFDSSELLCAKCSGSPSSCPKHGVDYIEFKCRFCCQIAVWFCWGNTHFCDPCHGKRPTTFPECPGAARCPLGIDHPPNGKEFSLGCALCRRGRERAPPPSQPPPTRIRSRVEVIDLEADQRLRRFRRDEKEIIILD